MKTFTVENFRAFGKEKQTARLAPLTLLVGENSTGKTSFMALIRAALEVSYGEIVPSFQDYPFDLGSFGDIVHNRENGVNGDRRFGASFVVPNESDGSESNGFANFEVLFDEREGAPFPTYRRFAIGSTTIDAHQNWRDGQLILEYSTIDAEPSNSIEFGFPEDDWNLFPVGLLPVLAERSHDIDPGSLDALREVIRNFRNLRYRDDDAGRQPYASAPIRSRPLRTYNQGVPMRDPEGERTATLLARMSIARGNEWEVLNEKFVEFGRESGLFDDIEIRKLGDSEDDPFQIRVRPGNAIDQSPFRNLADVGYGVSQILPVLTELLRSGAPRMSLLQQPEVHLHPSAQAALGTLFCSLAVAGKQLIVETHSDHVIDRVRMSVRDGASGIKPEDVSILYFERNGLGVKIHSISIDREGNIIGAPEDYRRFFMDEVERSIGLQKLGDES